jgi:hypothetical protein
MFEMDAYNIVVKASSDRNHLGIPETAENPRIFGPPSPSSRIVCRTHFSPSNQPPHDGKKRRKSTLSVLSPKAGTCPSHVCANITVTDRERKESIYLHNLIRVEHIATARHGKYMQSCIAATAPSCCTHALMLNRCANATLKSINTQSHHRPRAPYSCSRSPVSYTSPPPACYSSPHPAFYHP